MKEYIPAIDTPLDICMLEGKGTSPQVYTFKRDGKIEAKKYICLTEITVWNRETEEWETEKLPDQALLVCESLLVQQEEPEGETYKPGRHIRTFVVRLGNYECVVVEYEDRLQVALSVSGGNMLPKTIYSSKIYLPIFKSVMDNLSSEKDILKFEDLMEELKL